QRWSPVIRRTTQQRDALAEQLFELVEQTVSPLARVEPTEADPQLVEFNFRGSDLPRSGPDFAWVEPGDVLQPVMRPTAGDGSLLRNGGGVVLWTYLEVVEPPKAKVAKEGETAAPAATGPVGRLRSATQRPLAARKGRIEQVAIVLRGDQGDTRVHLQSRT